MVKKGQTFILDFLQSHIEISANLTCTDKTLVPIDQGKSILFEYQHLLAASMCDCKKSKMKVCPFLPFSYGLAWEIDGKWRDLWKNLGKPPCKVVPVVGLRNFDFSSATVERD